MRPNHGHMISAYPSMSKQTFMFKIQSLICESIRREFFQFFHAWSLLLPEHTWMNRLHDRDWSDTPTRALQPRESFQFTSISSKVPKTIGMRKILWKADCTRGFKKSTSSACTWLSTADSLCVIDRMCQSPFDSHKVLWSLFCPSSATAHILSAFAITFALVETKQKCRYDR